MGVSQIKRNEGKKKRKPNENKRPNKKARN